MLASLIKTSQYGHMVFIERLEITKDFRKLPLLKKTRVVIFWQRAKYDKIRT